MFDDLFICENGYEMTEEEKKEAEIAEEEFKVEHLKELKEMLGEKLFMQLFETKINRKYRFLEAYRCFVGSKKDVNGKFKDYELWKFPKELNITSLQGYWRYEAEHNWEILGGEPTECWTDYCFIKIKGNYLFWCEHS